MQMRAISYLTYLSYLLPSSLECEHVSSSSSSPALSSVRATFRFVTDGRGRLKLTENAISTKCRRLRRRRRAPPAAAPQPQTPPAALSPSICLLPPLLTASLDARDFTGAAADDGDDEFTLGGAEQFRSREENSIKDALISLKS